MSVTSYSNIILYFLFVFLTACGQQSEVVGPHQRVKYDVDIESLVTSVSQNVKGVCDPGASLRFESSGVVGGEVSSVCSAIGAFSVDVVLTSGDGDKEIQVVQTASETGALSEDSIRFNLDQNAPVLTADVSGLMAYGSGVLVVNVLQNDADLGRGLDPSSLSIVSGSPNGDCAILFGAVPTVSFTPQPGFSGTAQCTYQVADLLGNFSSSTVDFRIGPSTPVVANNNTVGGTQNIPVSVDVIADDVDADGVSDIDLSTFSIVTGTNSFTEGTCSVGPAPSMLTFSPVLNFFGTAVCRYEVCDFAGGCDQADFTVIVPDSTVPVAVKDTAVAVSGGTPVTADVAANDTDAASNLNPSSVEVLSSNGGVCSLSPTAPNIRFAQASGFIGLGSCTYRICDTQPNCTTGVFEITVNDGQAPNLSNDTAVTTANTATSPINVALNDLDPENQMDLSSVSIVAASESNGTCAVSPASPLVVFTPSLNAIGVGGCDYSLCDNAGNCSTASIQVTVNDINPPVANSDTTSTNQNTTSTAFDVSANDTDAESDLDAASVSLTGIESGGSCAISGASPNIEFVPDSDFAGTGSCGYRICDGSGNCSQSTLFVNVNDVTPPTVTVDQLSPGQQDPTNVTPITFTFSFSEEIDASSLVASDLDTSGSTATGGIYSFINTGDNKNFLLQISALGSEGTVQVSLPIGSFTDKNGVANTVASTNLDNSVLYDNGAPAKPNILSPVFSSVSNPNINLSCDPGSSIQLNGAGLSPNPYPAVAEVCPGGGSLTLNAVPLSGPSPYTLTATASDASGNQSVSDSFSLTVDAVRPNVDVVKVVSQSSPTNSLPIFFEVTFSEAIDVASFNSTDITNTGTASGGVWTIINTGDDQVFSISVNALTGDGTVVPSIAENLISDLSGNLNTASTSSGLNTVTYDGTVPLAPIITDPFFTQDATPTLVVDCDANEDLEFVITPFGGVNPVTSNCVGGSAMVTVPTALGADGVYSIQPTAIDGGGNRTDGNLFSLNLDRQSPSPTITLNAGQGTLVNSGPVFFDVSWDEVIEASSFVGADITNTGTASGGVWSVSNTGDSQNFVISVTGLTGDGSLIPRIGAGLANDRALNTNLVGTYAGTPVTLDTAPPSLPVVTSPTFTSDSTPTVSVTCDTSATSVNLIIAGYASSPVAGGACPAGTLNITLPTALPSESNFSITPVSSDAAGNLSTGVAFSMTLDQTAPSLILNRLVSQPTQTNLVPISFSATFSEPIDPTSFSASDINDINGAPAPGGSWSIVNSGDNTNFIISKSALTGSGFVQPQVPVGAFSDATGNTNALVSSVGANGDTVEYIVTPPGTPTVLSPAFTATLTPTVSVQCEVGSEIQLSITGYAPDPFPASPVNCASSPLNIPIAPAVASEGTYTIRAVAADSIGNQSISIPFDMVVDTTPPSVAISQAGGQLDPTRLLPIQYDVVFSEAIDATSFLSSDITNAGSISGGTWSIINSGDDQNFTIALSGLTVDGTVEPRLLAGVVSDKAGNLSLASTVPAPVDIEVEYDGTPPGIPSILSPRYTNSTSPNISVSCEVGSLVQVQSATINGGAAFPAVPVNCASSPVSIAVPVVLGDADYDIVALASDAVGNISNSSIKTMTVDTVNPEVTIDRLASATADRTNTEPVVFSVVFSEPIDETSFTSASVTNAGGALAPGLWVITNSGDNTNFTISATALAGAGQVEPQILGGALTDLAGNPNNLYTVVTDGDVYFDNIKPSPADIATWTWGMSSPFSGTFSTDGTPQVSLNGAGSEESGVIQLYDDSNCSSSAGSAVAINTGAANVVDITYVAGGAQDGLKDYFVRVTDDVGNVSDCTPVGLSYTFDTTAPVAFVTQAITQPDPAVDVPIFFEVLFNERIDPSTFTTADLSNVGSIGSVNFSIINSGDDTKFSIRVSDPDVGGTAVLEVATAAIEDLAGNLNAASVYSDNSINYACVNPAPITDMYYGPVTQTTVDLFWTVNPTIGCEPVSDYEVEFSVAGSGVWNVFADAVTPDPLATVTGLTPNTDYEFRIRAFNDLYSAHSNIVEVSTKPLSPFFDPGDFKLINLTGATDSTVVALEDSTDIFLTTDVNDPAPTLLASLDAGETHRFASVRGEILISTKPIFATGRIGASTFSCTGSGNPPWVSPLWSEKVLLFNASRNNPQTVYVFAYEDANVTIFRNNAVVVPSTFVAENTIAILSAPGTGAFRVEGGGSFIAATRHGTSFVDDMPALPKARQIMGYPSNAGLLSTVSAASINATLFHSDGNSLLSPVSSAAFTSMSPRGPTTSLYRSEALYVEADELISANNTADSDGCNSAPFNPIHLMMRRYAVNVDAQYVAFASTVPASVTMIRPDGTEAEFELARTGTGPFAAKSPYKYYLTNVEAGTRFEGMGPQDRYSVWYQSDTRDGAGYEDETIIYGYK